MYRTRLEHIVLLWTIIRVAHSWVTSPFLASRDATPTRNLQVAGTKLLVLKASVLAENSRGARDQTTQHLKTLVDSLQTLTASSSDIRGRVLDHGDSFESILEALSNDDASLPQLTPFAAYCFGHALATQLMEEATYADEDGNNPDDDTPGIIVGIGMDSRTHGARLADSLARGVESVDGVKAAFSGICTTPACATFVRIRKCDAAVMVTASHLPPDRNGLKIYSTNFSTGYSKEKIRDLGNRAQVFAEEWYSTSDNAPTPHFGDGSTVGYSDVVDWMPEYAVLLKAAILSKTSAPEEYAGLPLTGLKVILNPGNGAGGFFQTVLKDLGADVSDGMNLQPDGTFPNGVPNPEDPAMFSQTAKACEKAQADLGIMLDTDADRCGFVVPRTVTAEGQRLDYEALNRNRLIALLGVIFSQEHPGCAVVTDSVTSEGLATFLEENLGLQHVRYLKGYANVINKARELTESGAMNAELAIETSGHCAMKENSYLDDGTYTAVQIVSLLAREHQKNDQADLLSLIDDMDELDEVNELRMTAKDRSLGTTKETFETFVSEIERRCGESENWNIDEDNLEGIRIRLGDNQFFMLRMSLHDPIISLQIEAKSREEAQIRVIDPLQDLLNSHKSILDKLDTAVLDDY